MFPKKPLSLLIILAALMLFEPQLPVVCKQLLYSLSITIKSLIILLLPWVIFSLLFGTVVNLSRQASRLVGLVLLLICGSNLLSTLLSHLLGAWLYQWSPELPPPPQATCSLAPLWQLDLPVLLPNEVALLGGLLLGLLATRHTPKVAQTLANCLKSVTNKILGVISALIPLFIAGLVIKLKTEGTLLVLFRHYGAILVFIACMQYSYLLLIYWLLARRHWRRFLTLLKAFAPAAFSGLCSMSSAASLPLTLMGVKRCADHQELAQTTVSATVNTHLVGDCFAIPILAYAILKAFGVTEPSSMQYLQFALYFVLAKFSVAAIPGGGIIVMLPLLDKYLGFTPAMLSLITALYMLFDPIITSANVFGNGAFALFVDRLQSKKIKVS